MPTYTIHKFLARVAILGNCMDESEELKEDSDLNN